MCVKKQRHAYSFYNKKGQKRERSIIHSFFFYPFLFEFSSICCNFPTFLYLLFIFNLLDLKVPSFILLLLIYLIYLKSHFLWSIWNPNLSASPPINSLKSEKKRLTFSSLSYKTYLKPFHFFSRWIFFRVSSRQILLHHSLFLLSFLLPTGKIE